MFAIYKITNQINGKSYIGFTSVSKEERWKKHQSDAYRGSDFFFHRALRKYGILSFRMETLEEGWDPKIGKEIREPYWISVLKPEYNMTKGGEGTFGHTHSDEECLKISTRMIGNTHSLGIKRDVAWKMNQALRMIGNNQCEGRQNAKGNSYVLPIITCPYCAKEGGMNLMHRYHFNNCKRKVSHVLQQAGS